MTKKERRWAAEKMTRYGGSFAQYIGWAFLYADDTNGPRLYEAFPELFQHYLELWPMEYEVTTDA